MTNAFNDVDEVKAAVLVLLEDGPLPSGVLVKRLIRYGYNKHNGNVSHLYDYGVISRALAELYMADLVECYDDDYTPHYRLPISKN